MKRSLFLTIMAVIPAFFGFMFFLSPESMLGKYGFTLDAGMKIMGYSVGSMLIATGLLNFLSRNATLEAVRPVLITNIAIQALTGGTDLYGTVTGAMNSQGYGAVVMHGVFLCAFLYYLILDKAVAS